MKIFLDEKQSEAIQNHCYFAWEWLPNKTHFKSRSFHKELQSKMKAAHQFEGSVYEFNIIKSYINVDTFKNGVKMLSIYTSMSKPFPKVTHPH